jgi:hypothetical protein
MTDLAGAYQAAGKTAQALPLLEGALTLTRANSKPDQLDTLRVMKAIAKCYWNSGKQNQALSVWDEALMLRKAKFSANDERALVELYELATKYRLANQLDKASPLLFEAHKGLEKSSRRHRWNVLREMYEVAWRYALIGRPGNAIPLLETAYANHAVSQMYPFFALVGPSLIDAYAKAGDAGKARKLIPELLDRLRTVSEPYRAPMAYYLGHFGWTLVQLKAYAEAESLLRECLAIREKEEPENWMTYQTKSRLGAALLGQKKYAEAKTLLLAGYEWLKAHDTMFTGGATAEARDRLAELYSATNKPALAKKVQAERTQAEVAAAAAAPADQEIMAGRTQDAIGHLATASAANPNDTMLFQKVAVLQAWFGLQKDLADTCRRGLDLAKGTSIPETADRVAKACCVVPMTDKVQLEAVLALARKAAQLGKDKPNHPYFQMVLGMAEYRSGHFAEADKTLAAAMAAGRDNPHVAGTSAFFRAMSLFRQGKQAEARQLASAAVAKMKPLPKDEKNPLADNGSADDLILWLAYKEAKALIQFDAPPATVPK